MMYGQIYCQDCGRIDATLRHSVFTTVISVLILSHRSQSGGIYCSTCRKSRGNRAALISGLLGWWGIPFGIFWTIGALSDNLGGGKQDDDVNASLLRVLGLQLAHDNRLLDARQALETSQQFRFQPQVEEWLDEIDAEIGLPTTYLSARQLYPSPITMSTSSISTQKSNSPTPKAIWFLVPVAVVLLAIFIGRNGTPGSPSNRPSSAAASHRSATSTPIRTPRATATSIPKSEESRPTAIVLEPTLSNLVTPRAGSGFTDEFSSFGGSSSISLSEPGSVSGKTYIEPIAGPFSWSTKLRSMEGSGSVCVSVTGTDDVTWYYNANPTLGTWSVDRTNVADNVFEWVQPRPLPPSVGGSIERLEVRVRDGVPTFMVDGVDVAKVSGVPLPTLEGSQQPGFCASLTGQTQGRVTVVFESVELLDQ